MLVLTTKLVPLSRLVWLRTRRTGRCGGNIKHRLPPLAMDGCRGPDSATSRPSPDTEPCPGCAKSASHLPGTILTGITRPMMDEPAWRRDLESQGVLDRIGTVEEIAEAALYLVGPNSGFTTGHALTVDGGFLAKFPERLGL